MLARTRIVMSLAALVLAGCSSGGGGSTASPTTTAPVQATTTATATATTAPATITAATTVTTTVRTTAAPKGPPTADLTILAEAGAVETLTNPVITCNAPLLDSSLVIRVFAHGSDPTLSLGITIDAGKIVVLVGTGSGTAFHSRTFTGTGVSGFDAAKGVNVDTAVTEDATATGTPGDVVALTSIKGTVDCGNQTVGTSTVHFSGATAEGAIDSGAGPFRVECLNNPQGNAVTLVGFVKVGGGTGLFVASFGVDSINTFETVAGPPVVQHQYFVKVQGVSTLSASGAHVNGDAVEQSPAGGSAHTLHIEGDVTCGAVVNV